MKSFLEYVAEDLLAKYGRNLAHTAIVVPSKRAALWLNDYLAQAAGGPMWSPACVTISDLFRRQSTLRVADELRLVCELYPVFVAQTGTSEALDEFYGWGRILLSDFNDIDKNLADARQIYSNIASWHEMDTAAFLSPEQEEALKRFFADFSADHTTLLKQKFLRLWSHMGDIYRLFNQRLTAKGLCYEGALYRSVVERGELCLPYDRLFFVGFNALTAAERKLFSLLKKQNKAFFYWDYDHYYLKDHEAGQFIGQYLLLFPNELPDNPDIYDNFSRPKQITFLSAGTHNMQARYIGQWLKSGHGEPRIADSRQTAIILCNEQLLPTAIHCWPDTAAVCNVTMGYPLAQAPVAALLQALISLQRVGADERHDTFRLPYLVDVLRHPYAPFVSPECDTLLEKLVKEKRYYPRRDTLTPDQGTTLLFGHRYTQNQDLLAWLIAVIERVGESGAQQDPFFALTTYAAHQLLVALHSLVADGLLNVSLITLTLLIRELLSQATVPLEGEPVEGIQMMGLLESRNLDFTHLLILSADEGTLPPQNAFTSFIPMAIRSAFGLSTPTQREAIVSHTFHRLLQRATDITITFNNAPSPQNRGERSRFLSQLLVEDNHHTILQRTLDAPHQTPMFCPKAIEKTPEIMAALIQRFQFTGQEKPPMFSPSAINKYLRCPLIFYYKYVEHIDEPDPDDSYDIDPRTFGKVLHSAAENLYKPYLGKTLPNDLFLHPALHAKVKQAVDVALAKHLSLRLEDLSGRQIINREVVLSYVSRLAKADSQTLPLRMEGLEEKVTEKIDIPGACTVMLGGIIDRRDIIQTPHGPRMRIVDYKTGVSPKYAPLDVDQIFAPDEENEQANGYHLQTMIYAHIVANSPKLNPQGLPVSPALLYVRDCQKDGYDPTLTFGKGKEAVKITDIRSYDAQLMSHLHTLLTQIFAPQGEFQPAPDTDKCQFCAYRKLCQKN